MLQGLSALVEDEASNNPAFAAKLDALIRPPEKPSGARPKTSAKLKAIDVPDVHAELAARGDEDFRAWLSAQPADVLKAIIRRQDLDPSRRSSKWKDEKKLANFIADGLRSRLSRGSAFIGRTYDQS
nr:hypothetical protein [Caballeronia sp. INDeC2]